MTVKFVVQNYFKTRQARESDCCNCCDGNNKNIWRPLLISTTIMFGNYTNGSFYIDMYFLLSYFGKGRKNIDIIFLLIFMGHLYVFALCLFLCLVCSGYICICFYVFVFGLLLLIYLSVWIHFELI